MKLLQIILACIYPARCPLCHDIIVPRGQLICNRCRKNIKILTEPRCKRCSKPLLDKEKEYCYDCEHTRHWFDEGFAVFPYNRQMQESMSYFKFHGRREYGQFYGRMLGEKGAYAIKRWKPQVIIPVPVHRKKQKKRGYNQAEVIGNVLSKQFSIPIRTDLIERIRDTAAQKELNPNERRKNLTHAFLGKNVGEKYSRVLLVDDIYTTGSTVDEVAKELKKCGVKQVFFATVCIGSGF